MRGPKFELVAAIITVFVVIAQPSAAEDETPKRKKLVVRSIEWIGNEAITSRKLRAHILTQSTTFPRFWVAHKFREDDLIGDMDRIAALYRLRGYYEAKAEYRITRDDAGEMVAIEIRIDEGAPVHTYQFVIRLDNGRAVSSHPLIDGHAWEEFLATLRLHRGKVFKLDHYREAREKTLAYLAEQGLPEARLNGGAEVDLKLHRATVHWDLTTGRHIRLGEVRISGLDSVDEKILRREIRLEPGETYSLSRMAETRRRLQNLNLFRWTVVEAEAAEADDSEEPDTPEEPEAANNEATWPVDIRVAERPPRRVSVGGGWGTDTSFRAELAWHHRNFFGGARHADVALRYSALGASLRPTFMEPYFLGTKTQLRITPAFLLENQEAYTARRTLLDVNFTRKLIERWIVRFGYRFARDDVFSVEDEVPGDDDLPEGIAINTGPHMAVRRSTVENPLNARNGTILDLSAETSVSALGSDEDFIRYTADARGFVELFSTVVATRVLLGTIQPLSNTQADEIPLVERFFSGGSSSMRGFGYRRLGPEDINGDSIGGASLIESSVEWRIPVFRSLGIVGFVDAAFLGADSWSWKLEKLRYAAGPGIRFDTPAGPIRVDFAWRLNPRDDRGTFRISASLGHTF